MLQEFRVDNFKSLINIVFAPATTNLLLGMNNSGKTNLCEALRFMSFSSSFSLDLCAEKCGGRFGMTSFVLDKSTIDFYVRAAVPHEGEDLVFEYELTVAPPGNRAGETSVRLEREVLSVTGGAFDKTVLLENVSGRIRLLHEEDSPMRVARYVETTAPTDATMVQRLYDTKASPRANLFKHYLSGWTYYDLSPAALRGSSYKPRERLIASDGGNLASVLYWLKTGDERAYRRLLKVTRTIEPSLDLINFRTGSEDHVFMYLEDRGRSLVVRRECVERDPPIPGARLRPAASARNRPSPLYMIEEPENGIHVRFLKVLFDMVDQSAGSPQTRLHLACSVLHRSLRRASRRGLRARQEQGAHIHHAAQRG